MPIRKLLISVTVARGDVVTKTANGGERHRPEQKFELKPGDVFDFTDDELADVTAGYGEGAVSETGEASLESGQLVSTEVKGSKKTGGKKTGAANKQDEL